MSRADLLAVIVRHERAAQRKKELKSLIGDSLAQCSVALDYAAAIENARFGDYQNVEAKYYDGKFLRTHLHSAFEAETDASYGDRRLRESEISDFLIDEGDCRHCQQAWLLIQERKRVNQDLGGAKRAIRNIGRAAIKRVAS